MGLEIERKFLVNKDLFKPSSKGEVIHQRYLKRGSDHSIRIRIMGNVAFLTIKSRVSDIVRNEFEYEIPLKDANEMIKIFKDQPSVEKIRYQQIHDSSLWVVDEFLGENDGLLLAEIELKKSDSMFTKPEWLLEEVTHDARYHNSNLAVLPYNRWQDSNS